MTKAVEILHENLKTKCNVILEEINNPKLKIVGINNLENMDEEELEQDINNRNFADYSKGCTVLHTYYNNHKGTQTAIIEVPSDLYKHIRSNKNKVFVGYQKCMAYDIIDVKPCYSCGRFGHKSKKCRNSATCIKCAGSHKVSECKAKEKRLCANCVFSNKRYQTSYDIKHEATDYSRCEVFKKMVRKYIEATDYSVEPIIAKEFGKVGNYFNSPKSGINRNLFDTRPSSVSIESLNSINDKLNNSK